MIRVWAPHAERVDLVTDGDAHPMVDDGGGWHRTDIELLVAADYAFSLDGGPPRPDPRSRWQPDGVHGPTRVLDDAAFPWTDDGWRGFHLPGAVLYELHVGTFTDDGTFDAAIGGLDHLVALGIDAVEIMPVAAFDGDRGWGYDGVALGATHEPYGGPNGFKRFVDAAHSRGIGVLLDVVYNHLGPTGAYLQDFGPYFSEHHTTPWGAGLNLDGPDSFEVRRFLIDNARTWLRDHHLDGLRLDAVHALADSSARHVLADLADEVAALAAHVRRPLWLIAENDTNDPRLVRAADAGGTGLHAVWADDLHHAEHALLTGEQRGYYEDYGSVADLAKALTDVYVYDGRWSPSQQAVRGAPVGDLPRDRFVTCIQNHDQIGNRAKGERLEHLVGGDLARVAAAILLCAPSTPMLFMGEEWAASTPFPYFVGERGDEVDAAVRNGRRAEFAAFGWNPADVPDPIAPATRDAAVLQWDEREAGKHAAMLRWYRALLALRRTEAALTDARSTAVAVRHDEAARWLVMERGTVELVVNLASDAQRVPLRLGAREIVLESTQGVAVAMDAVVVPARSATVLRWLEGTKAG